VEQVTEVDRAAFEQLYKDHYWALLRFAARRTTDHERARDVVAETFAIAWRRRRALPKARALPWLYKIASNVLSNGLRSAARASELNQTVGGYSLTGHQVDVAEQTEWSHAFKAVMQTLQTLSKGDQQVLMLHAWEGLTGRELGIALDCSAAAASVRLHRARQRLNAALRDREVREGSHKRSETSTLKEVRGE
jgi:RNA polymerase sigma-70 factor (ECF subfamily)